MKLKAKKDTIQVIKLLSAGKDFLTYKGWQIMI